MTNKMNREPWKLKRVRQCPKCPWRKDVNPTEIPNGYDVQKHAALQCTIAGDVLGQVAGINGPQHVMACHETHDAHCVGWLVNQMGVGNNIGLRLSLMSCQNLKDVKTVGEQHECFEATKPKGKP